MKRENKKTERPYFYKGKIVLFFIVILLFLLGLDLHRSIKETKRLNVLLKKGVSRRERAQAQRKKMFFATSVLSELKGWQTLPPPSSIKEFEQIPSGLMLKEYSLTRNFSISILNEKKSPKRLPKPIRVICFSDFISIDVDEETKGSGVHIFPQLKTTLETMCSCKLQSLRNFSSIEEEKNPTEKASWVISGEKPPLPLWAKSIK